MPRHGFSTYKFMLLTILIVLIVVGIVLYCINEFIPLDPKIKKILNIVVVIFVIIWLLNIVGAFGYIERVKI